MRWLLRRSDDTEHETQVMSLADPAEPSEKTEPTGVRFLPTGELSVAVATADDARRALLELQARQRALLAARARAAGGGVTFVSRTMWTHLRLGGRQVRRLRPRGSFNPARSNAVDVVGDSLSLLPFAVDSVAAIDDALELVGAAAKLLADIAGDIDLSDFNF